jgi:hypothetical protein
MTTPEAPSPNQGQDAQVILFPRLPGYAEAMAPHTISTMLRLGLDHDFVPILEQHLTDLHIAIRDDRHTTSNVPPTGLTVVHRDDTSHLGLQGRGQSDWERELGINQTEIQLKAMWLQDQVGNQTGELGDRDAAHNVALDWIYHTHSVAALGNAVHMQRNHGGKYHVDFNGQSTCFQTERTVSAEYSRLQGVKLDSIQDDTDSLMLGYGALMLHETMLTHGLVERATLATMIVNGLRKQLDGMVMSPFGVRKRIQALEPIKNPLKKYEEFSALYINDPTEDEYDDPLDD